MDELARSIERGMVTETEFSESMKQRLEKGYILPGQMRELFSCKEILAKMEKMACISLVALDLKNSHVDIKEKIWKERDLKRIELSGGGNGKREKPTDRGT